MIFMRSKDLRNLRKAFENLQGSFDAVLKRSAKPSKKTPAKKVSVKNEDYDDLEDEEDEDYADDELEDDGDVDAGLDAPAGDDDSSVLETAEAIVDLVESLPTDVEEEVKDQLLGDAADEVEDGVPADEVVENVRRRVRNIRRKVNNARRARIANARRLKNVRRSRLFNAAAAEGLLNKAGSKYQNPMSKFQNARKRYAWNDDAGDLNNGEGNGYREAESGDSIGSIGKPSDDGYGGDEDNNYWPNEKQSGKSAINTYNARVRRIINKARAYDALMNGLGCSGGSCDPGKINLNNKDERDAYNAGVLQNGRYFLYNGRVYTYNAEGDPVPASTEMPPAAPEGPAAPEAGAEAAPAAAPFYDEEQNALVIPLGEGESEALAEDIESTEAPAEGLGYEDMGAADLPGAAGAPPAAAPIGNQRGRRRVRNNRGYRSVYNQQMRIKKAAPQKSDNSDATKTQETQVNNSVPETGLDIPSTFPSKKAE